MHPVVDDELAQLERIQTVLNENPYEAPPKEADLVAELVRLREELPTVPRRRTRAR